MKATLKPHLLCIVPPYDYSIPPHGVACLMGYLKASGCYDFDFLDLRLWTSTPYIPTYDTIGAFGETYVIDIPDLPLVLKVLAAFDEGTPVALTKDEMLTRYALDRGKNPDALLHYLQKTDIFLGQAFSKVEDLRFIGFSTWSSNYLTTLMAAVHLKRRANPPFIVFGGPQTTQSTAAAHLALRSGLADAVVLGEGEETLLQLYRAFYLTNGQPGPVAGCLQRNPSGGFVSTPRSLMKLPEKPLPDFSCMPIFAYQKHSFGGIRNDTRLLPFEVSRGCTDKCSFCSEWVFWKHFRLDKPTHVLAQMKALMERYQVQGFLFSDSLLNGVKRRLVDFAEGILSMNLSIKWGGFLRADIDPETARLIKRAGCEYAFVGVESMSDETLSLMNKRRTRADNIEALYSLLDAGLSHVCAGLIPGFPGDSRDRFTRTVLELGKIQARYPMQFRVNKEPFSVLAGQPILNALDDYGLTPHPWDEAVLDLAPSYREITENIHCTVTGPNQGVERMGQLNIAFTFSSGSIYAEREVSARLSDADFTYHRLRGHWYLAEFMSAVGNHCALILSSEEKEQFERLKYSRTFSEESAATFAAFAEACSRNHLVGPSLDSVEGRCIRNEQSLHAHDLLTLSPFALCRTIQEDEQRLLLVDRHSRGYLMFDPSFESVLLAMKAGLLTDSQYCGLLRQQGVSDKDAHAARDDMLSLGLAVVSDDKFEHFCTLLAEPGGWPL